MKVKIRKSIFFLILLTITISGCIPASNNLSSSLGPERSTNKVEPSQVPSPATFTHSISATSTVIPTVTPLPTLNSQEAEKTIAALMNTNNDCEAPCFWRIIPGKTTYKEVKNYLWYMGTEIWETTIDGNEIVQGSYNLQNDIEVSFISYFQDGVVESIRASITSPNNINTNNRQWSAYSPETLIARYGPPSEVKVEIDRGPAQAFSMVMFYETRDLIIEYVGYKILQHSEGEPEICPLIADFTHVSVWFGKNPEYPPLYGVPIEEATISKMSIEDFSKRMTGNPEDAYFTMIIDKFQ